MKRSALLLTTALLTSAYAMGIVAYVAYTSTYAATFGNWADSFIVSFNNALLGGHSLSIFIAAVLVWVAYMENHAICAAVGGALLAFAAFEFIGVFPFVTSLVLSSLSFMGIQGAQKNKEQNKLRAEEQATRREERSFIAQGAAFDASPTIDTSISYDDRQDHFDEPTHRGLRNTAYTLLFLLLAAALVYFGPHVLTWYEGLLSRILEWSKSIA